MATLGEIAAEIGAQLRGDPDYEILDVAALSDAGSGDLSFYTGKRYYPALIRTRAGAVILSEADAPAAPAASLIAEDPYLAYAKAARFLHPPAGFSPGIHPSAVIDAGANLATDCFIGANCVIGKDATVGAATWVGPGCVLGEKVVVGDHCHLHAGVTLLERVRIGARAMLHSGVVIGADGYGIADDGGRWLKIPQLGGVVIGDDVEIGANTTIDRGALEDTVIEDGVRIDNLVQIGHNVRVGAHTAIAGAAALAGSVKVGKRCRIGGASAIAGHIEIADDVVITGMSAVPNSIREAGVYSSGVPIVDNKTWRRNMARLRHLDEIVKRLIDLERQAEK